MSRNDHPQRNGEVDRVPLMFQAQIAERGKIQYAGNVEPASKWVGQWLEGCPPAPERFDEDIPQWKRRPTHPIASLPEFGRYVKTKEYQIRWRLVTNSGQDEDVIRPVIGAKGLPFFPGSSMKGAFRRACLTEADQKRYCGGEESTAQGEKKTLPGLLRFHGGYPIDMASWADRDRLVDVVHSQQSYQVMQSNAKHTANVQISLYRPKLKFGISSVESLSDEEWTKIWKIWEWALENGLGSRVSAGYGYVEEVEAKDSVILSVHLKGRGLTSQLLNDTPEFRPNMFKASLRGNTLRILSGLTDETTTKSLTNQLWGGIDDKAIVGKVGISFSVDSEDLNFGAHIYRPKYKPVSMQTYHLKHGYLDLIQVKTISPELEKFLKHLVRFTCLLGGFGKSWRRIHHGLFYPSYFEKGDKPMIGCHWEVLPESAKFWIITKNINQIAGFLDKTREVATTWLKIEQRSTGEYVQHWREAWHPSKVQVWGRLKKKNDNTPLSLAVEWLHGDYFSQQSIKNSELAGWAAKRGAESQVGRIWHRMYPRYVKNRTGNLVRLKDEYVELLTIFPDESDRTQQFLDFLTHQTDFVLLWGVGQNS